MDNPAAPSPRYSDQAARVIADAVLRDASPAALMDLLPCLCEHIDSYDLEGDEALDVFISELDARSSPFRDTT